MDNVNHPSHYNQRDIETIDLIQAFLDDDDDFEGFLFGNVIKYLDRFKFKNGAEDLKKAQWYLKKYIDVSDEEIEDADLVFKVLYNGEFDAVEKAWKEERQIAENRIDIKRKEEVIHESVE